MTDNEIIKALECCINNNGICEDCHLLNKRNSSIECTNELMRDALDLINRQKVEIEKMKKLKENAKRIQENCENFPICVGCSFALPNGGCVFEETSPSNWELDDIKEEMVGEDK